MKKRATIIVIVIGAILGAAIAIATTNHGTITTTITLMEQQVQEPIYNILLNGQLSPSLTDSCSGYVNDGWVVGSAHTITNEYPTAKALTFTVNKPNGINVSLQKYDADEDFWEIFEFPFVVPAQTTITVRFSYMFTASIAPGDYTVTTTLVNN
jgi:hypothetical protein